MKLFVIFITSAFPLFAQTSREPEELTKLKASWTSAKAEATKPLDAKYAAALTAMKDKFTKAGNLDAAITVDKELKTLMAAKDEDAKLVAQRSKEEIPRGVAEGNLFEEFQGTWTVTYKNGFTHKYKITKDGSVKILEGGSGDRKLYRIKNDVMMDFADNKIERLYFVRNKLYVEHWHPAKDYADKKPAGDFGVSLEEKE